MNQSTIYKGRTNAEDWVEGDKNIKRLIVSASQTFTVVSAEDVANIVDPGWNLTSKMVNECDSDVVTESFVSTLQTKGCINKHIWINTMCSRHMEEIELVGKFIALIIHLPAKPTTCYNQSIWWKITGIKRLTRMATLKTLY
jgi:hypothetical protein